MVAALAMQFISPTIFSMVSPRGQAQALKVNALSANPAVMTCLANDIGYERIYSEQLAVMANWTIY